MDKALTMNCDDAVDYVRKNVKEFDKVELSYHRIFTPGEVLSIETGECDEEGVCRLMVQVSGDTIGNTVELDLEEIKDDLVEIKHMPREESDAVIISIERCETDLE